MQIQSELRSRQQTVKHDWEAGLGVPGADGQNKATAQGGRKK